MPVSPFVSFVRRHANPDTPHTALHGPCGFPLLLRPHSPETGYEPDDARPAPAHRPAPASAPDLAAKVETNVLVTRRLTPDRTTYATGFPPSTVSEPQPDFPSQTPTAGYPSPSGIRGSASTPFVLTGKRFPAFR